jgi:hypothetical protein
MTETISFGCQYRLKCDGGKKELFIEKFLAKRRKKATTHNFGLPSEKKEADII